MPKRAPADPWRRWHRLFGLLLTDHLRGSPFSVELEKDLSQRQQLLDVVVVRREKGKMSRTMPDGLHDLTSHNLITIKSYWEPFDDWTLKELTGHYVNYRKQVSPSRQELLPEEEFRLFGICARHPQALLRVVEHERIQPGVYDCRRGTDVIRLIVARDLPQTDENALLHLFSAATEQVKFGAERYQLQSPDTSSIVNQLFGAYRREGLTMPYTMQDFRREVIREYLEELTPEQRREFMNELTPEKWREFMKESTPQQRREFMKELTSEQRRELMKGLTPQHRREYLGEFTPEERLSGLTTDEIKAHLAKMDKGRATKQKKAKRRSR
jgi:hypothetical protein